MGGEGHRSLVLSHHAQRIWAQHATSHYHIFFAAGILHQYRADLLGIQQPDELLKVLFIPCTPKALTNPPVSPGPQHAHGDDKGDGVCEQW